LTITISSTCFGRWFRPSSGALDCVYSLWYNAPAMLLAGDKDEFHLICFNIVLHSTRSPSIKLYSQNGNTSLFLYPS